ncbi:MAG: hypothetical protein R2770_14790 [Acidimicrobiales bacterium]
MKTRQILPIVALLASAGAACSGSVDFSIGGKSPEDVAVELIEGELSDQIGVELTGECPELEDPEDGAVFECQGLAADGRVVHFEATIDEAEEMVNLVSTNVVSPDNLSLLEADAARLLGEQVGADLPAENYDCGDGPTIVPDSGELDCALTDPSNGDVYDSVLTLDLQTGSFDISVADQPRG